MRLTIMWVRFYLLISVSGAIMIGLVAMIFRYQWDLNIVFYDLSIHYSELVRMDTDIKGMQPILSDITKLAHSPRGAAIARQWHTFKVEDLSFHHARTSEQAHVINRVNFTVKRGEKIALIGATGAVRARY